MASLAKRRATRLLLSMWPSLDCVTVASEENYFYFPEFLLSSMVVKPGHNPPRSYATVLPLSWVPVPPTGRDRCRLEGTSSFWREENWGRKTDQGLESWGLYSTFRNCAEYQEMEGDRFLKQKILGVADDEVAWITVPEPFMKDPDRYVQPRRSKRNQFANVQHHNANSQWFGLASSCGSIWVWHPALHNLT